MNKNILAICDKEEEYVYRFQEYLNRKNAYSFQIQVFTSIEQLFLFRKENKIDILILSENLYSEKMQHVNIKNIVLLSESNISKKEDMLSIKKYQSIEKIMQEILNYFDRKIDRKIQFSLPSANTKLIGIYTPVGRCLQTSFALLLGQFLAEKKAILYLNFEPFSGFGKFLKREYSSDLIDLMYLMSTLQDNFILKFKEIVQSINGMDYIPPAFSFLDLSLVTEDKWIHFLNSIMNECNYNYIILDLSDNVQGLLSILQKCEAIYTITKEDGVALAKIDQYEKLLKSMDYQDVLEKTSRFKFPLLKNISYEIEELPYSELAKYVKAIIKEDLHEEISGI